MNVELASAETRLVDLELSRMTLDITQSNPGRFLHDIAQLSGKNEPAVTRHRCGFDEEHVAAGSRYGQTCCHARDRGRGCRLVLNLRPAQRIA